MNKQLKQLLVLLICLFIALPSWAKLTPQQEQAKQKGIILFQQYKHRASSEYMLQAAEAGDVEAMVYLGISYKVAMPFSASEWLEKAANQGDIYAMYQLSLNGAIWDQFGYTENKHKTNWKKKGAELSLEKAKQGDPEAMYLYYRFTGDLNWLKKSADLGWLSAQDSIADIAADGKGSFANLSKKDRNKIAIELSELAAKNGSLSSATYLASYYANIHENTPPIDQAKAQTFLLQAVEGSYLSAVETYISALEGYKAYQKFGFEKDPVKAYALSAWMVDTGIRPAFDLDYYTNGSYNPPLTPEQIKQGNALKEQWAKTHPPLTNGNGKLLNVNRP